MNYIKRKYKHGLLVKHKYKQELEEITNLKKGKARQLINTTIFDPEDSIADNNKLITLLMSIILKLYNVDFNKDNLSDSDRYMIEAWLELFGDTTTRFDIQFAEEGYSLLLKLLNRQEEIANIIESTYNKTGVE